MHFKAHLITKEFPTDDVIEKILRPFNSEDYYSRNDEHEPYPVFTWDWFQVGGRYNGFFELDIDKTMEKYNWQFVEDRVNKVFRSFLFDRIYAVCDERKKWLINEEDFYSCLGSKDSILRVDGGLIADMKEFDITSCFIIIDVNGHAYARSSWNGNENIINNNFDEEAKAVLEASKDYYIVTVDLHD